MTLKSKWISFAATGIVLMGVGLSTIAEGAVLKWQAEHIHDWFWIGLLGLISFFAGISIFGQAVVYKGKLDAMKE